jgi:hypothetical protein
LTQGCGLGLLGARRGGSAIETQPIPNYRKVADVAREARSMLWRTKAQAWPCWLGWSIVGAGMAPPFKAAPVVGVSGNVALAVGLAVGTSLLLVFTCRILLGASHPWRIDRTFLRAAGGVGLLFVPASALQTVVVPMAPAQPLWVLVSLPLVLGTLALALWPFGAALGDETFTPRAALGLLGRTFWTIYWAITWMTLIVVLPVVVPLMFLSFDLVFLPVLSGIMMAASAMVWTSVLAAVYGLWRRRRELDAEVSGAALGQVDGALG